MRIAIFGTGGVGGRFGAQLASAGEDVTFIARGEHLHAIQTQGLHLAAPAGDIVIHPARASDDAAQVGEVDLVILGVKSWQVKEAAKSMQPLIGQNTVVLPLQNGIEAAAQLSEVLGTEHVIGGLCGTFSWVASPGHIHSVGQFHFINLAELDNTSSARTENIRKVFEREGIDVGIPLDIHSALWSKFMFVASFGGVGAITRAPIGVIRALPETRKMLESCMQEINSVAKAYEISLSDDIIERTMDSVDAIPPEVITSLHRDIANDRPSELDAWSGAVVRYGKKSGITTPTHEFIYHCLLPLELRARQQVEFPE